MIGTCTNCQGRGFVRETNPRVGCAYCKETGLQDNDQHEDLNEIRSGIREIAKSTFTTPAEQHLAKSCVCLLDIVRLLVESVERLEKKT